MGSVSWFLICYGIVAVHLFKHKICLILIWQKCSLKDKTELWSVRFFHSVNVFAVYSSLDILVWGFGFFLMYIYQFYKFFGFNEVFRGLWVFPQGCENECENLFSVFSPFHLYLAANLSLIFISVKGFCKVKAVVVPSEKWKWVKVKEDQGAAEGFILLKLTSIAWCFLG